MRMLLVMEELQCGGAELSFFALARALSEKCEVHLALSQDSLGNATISRLCDSLKAGPITIHASKTLLNGGTFNNLHPVLRRTAACELASIMDVVRPDIVIANLPTVERGQAVVDAVRTSQGPHPPVWGLLHLTQKPSELGARLGQIRNLMAARLIRRFDRIINVSQAAAQEMAESYGIHATQVIQPATEMLQPLPLEADRAGLRQEQGLPNRFLLGMVGRVRIHHKGHDVALRVIQGLLAEGYASHLVVIGDGPDLEALRATADRKAIRDAVTFLGWRNDIQDLLPLLDVVLMPSRYEGLPQVAVQAVSANIPVVGYAVGGLTELLPSGFAIPYGAEEQLTAAVAALARDPQRWPAEEVRRRAMTWCEPRNVAAKLLEMASS
jgi:glycosyltransferase involved in cell wall biosynthesis